MSAEREGGAAAWLAGTLVVPILQGHDCLCPRSYGPIRVFFQASCSWLSEGLFGQSFSIALPIWALRGLPHLGSFSVVWHIRHIEGPHGWGPAHQALKGALWVGFCSVAQCIRHLMGQPLYCSARQAHRGAPRLGSYSADWCIRHLKGHPGWGPTL